MIMQDEIDRIMANARTEQREMRRSDYGDGYADIMEFIEAVESIAFDIPPPNRWTPKLVQLCQVARHNANELRVEKPNEWPDHQF